MRRFSRRRLGQKKILLILQSGYAVIILKKQNIKNYFSTNRQLFDLNRHIIKCISSIHLIHLKKIAQ